MKTVPLRFTFIFWRNLAKGPHQLPSATSKFGQILSSSRIWEKRGLKGELAPRAPVLPRFYRYGAQPETLENRYTGAARKRAQRGGARPCATAPGSQ